MATDPSEIGVELSGETRMLNAGESMTLDPNNGTNFLAGLKWDYKVGVGTQRVALYINAKPLNPKPYTKPRGPHIN